MCFYLIEYNIVNEFSSKSRKIPITNYRHHSLTNYGIEVSEMSMIIHVIYHTIERRRLVCRNGSSIISIIDSYTAFLLKLIVIGRMIAIQKDVSKFNKCLMLFTH